MATSLYRLQPNFTAVLCTHVNHIATNPENLVKIGRIHFQEIGLVGIVKTGSTFRS